VPEPRTEPMSSETAAAELARALKELVNAPLPEDLHVERPFWVAARKARATLDWTRETTGINGDQVDA
jgi:hypothetical protein